MESEERPAKMRKLDHTEESGDVAVTDSTPANGTTEAQTTPAQLEQQTPDEAQIQESLSAEVSASAPADLAADGETPKLSKNQLKKKARLEKWESGREDRKLIRKQKIKEKKERRREEFREALAAADDPDSVKPKFDLKSGRPHKHVNGTKVPITVIFDCDFEDLMFDNEMKSLGLQITRCYSDARKAKYQPHIAVSSFGGKMKERFDGILAKQYTSWKGVRFCEEDFVEVADKAKEWMTGEKGGVVAGPMAKAANVDSKDDGEEGEIVYLSSESDNVLERLKPNSTYIIGGLVDKNRHKGICHRRAVERGIKTAKLPIGEFLHMKSRQVLVTNHVLEIMLKWMEFGDWGKAFMAVLPERKGAMLKSEYEESAQKEGEDAKQKETAEDGEQSKADQEMEDRDGAEAGASLGATEGEAVNEKAVTVGTEGTADSVTN